MLFTGVLKAVYKCAEIIDLLGELLTSILMTSGDE